MNIQGLIDYRDDYSVRTAAIDEVVYTMFPRQTKHAVGPLVFGGLRAAGAALLSGGRLLGGAGARAAIPQISRAAAPQISRSAPTLLQRAGSGLSSVGSKLRSTANKLDAAAGGPGFAAARAQAKSIAQATGSKGIDARRFINSVGQDYTKGLSGLQRYKNLYKAAPLRTLAYGGGMAGMEIGGLGSAYDGLRGPAAPVASGEVLPNDTGLIDSSYRNAAAFNAGITGAPNVPSPSVASAPISAGDRIPLSQRLAGTYDRFSNPTKDDAQRAARARRFKTLWQRTFGIPDKTTLDASQENVG